jgi:hypothetical protein
MVQPKAPAPDGSFLRRKTHAVVVGLETPQRFASMKRLKRP